MFFNQMSDVSTKPIEKSYGAISDCFVHDF